MKSLGGIVCVRNNFALDYSLEETVKSLLPHVSQLVICDSDSTDGTEDFIREWAHREPKINPIHWPWPNPVAQPKFWTEWLNYARAHLRTDLMIELDADEILDDSPECAQAILDARASDHPRRLFDRHNFWRNRDGRICVVPEGHLVGRWVARLGEAHVWLPSDEIHTGRASIRDSATKDDRLKIFHIGFLRREQEFFAKAKVCLGAWCGSYDDRLEKAENEGKPYADMEGLTFRDGLAPYEGHWPALAREWLTARGHSL